MPAPPHTTRSRGYLPHWESPLATYSVTFRLADSLPQKVLDSYVRERRDIVDTAACMQRPLPHTATRQCDGPMKSLNGWGKGRPVYLQADAFGGYDGIYRGEAGGKVNLTNIG